MNISSKTIKKCFLIWLFCCEYPFAYVSLKKCVSNKLMKRKTLFSPVALLKLKLKKRMNEVYLPIFHHMAPRQY